MAEREGFEPPDPYESTVFKTAAFDHSATSPQRIGSCAAYISRATTIQEGSKGNFPDQQAN